MRDWPKTTAFGLVALQLADAVGNALVPDRILQPHFDRLRVPQRVRPLFPAIKVASSAGLVLGLKWRRLGVVTSVCTVGYYAAAVGFHLRAGDHPFVAVPAAAFGGSAVVALVTYLP